MCKIINLTQHSSTEDQKAVGVCDFEGPEVKELLTFETLPTTQEVRERARQLAKLAKNQGYHAAMIAGAPWLMPPLVEELKLRGVIPLFSFSVRKSEHEGFIEG